MSIKPGDLTSSAAFADSMAQAIETELNRLLVNDGLPALPVDDSLETRDRRRLFVAIARGVVRHMAENRAAVTVERTDGTTVSPVFDIDGL